MYAAWARARTDYDICKTGHEMASAILTSGFTETLLAAVSFFRRRSLAAESAAYWRGLQAQAAGSGYTVLEDCRTLDLGMVRGGGMAGELLGAMQDATKVRVQ